MSVSLFTVRERRLRMRAIYSLVRHRPFFDVTDSSHVKSDGSARPPAPCTKREIGLSGPVHHGGDGSSEVFASAASLWEISIKCALGALVEALGAQGRYFFPGPYLAIQS